MIELFRGNVVPYNGVILVSVNGDDLYTFTATQAGKTDKSIRYAVNNLTNQESPFTGQYALTSFGRSWLLYIANNNTERINVKLKGGK